MSGSGRLHSTAADRGDIRKMDMSGKSESTRKACAALATLTPKQRLKLVPAIEKLAERRRRVIETLKLAGCVCDVNAPLRPTFSLSPLHPDLPLSTRAWQPDASEEESGGGEGELGAGATTSG